ncbi:MAG: hypothetical protein ACXWPG_01105, partial [Ktedonobacteraceae bacterium]
MMTVGDGEGLDVGLGDNVGLGVRPGVEVAVSSGAVARKEVYVAEVLVAICICSPQKPDESEVSEAVTIQLVGSVVPI